jgi:hypothetical protein
MMATQNPFQGDDKDPFSAARGEDGGIKKQAPAPKKQTFGQAFAAARRAGKKTFTHNGKSFTTETKDDVKKRDDAKKRDAVKKRDDADFAKEAARDKTTRAVAGDSDNRQRDAEDRRRLAPIAAQGQRDRQRDAEDRRRLAPIAAQGQRDSMASGSRRAAAAKRKVSGLAKGGSVRSVRGYGAARTPNKKM